MNKSNELGTFYFFKIKEETLNHSFYLYPILKYCDSKLSLRRKYIVLGMNNKKYQIIVIMAI